ncbi:glucose-repressible protein Grg1, partial [Salmonella enterica subsp. enterica serovar Typhi]|nr:glucose-repressible protein Grg1 [Salmonella enterica subsp. enterica serovar Typhi]
FPLNNQTHTMDAIKNTVNQATESVQGAMYGASKQGNEEIAKGNTDANATTRLTAGKDAISDKLDEKKHDTKADVYANK